MQVRKITSRSAIGEGLRPGIHKVDARQWRIGAIFLHCYMLSDFTGSEGQAGCLPHNQDITLEGKWWSRFYCGVGILPAHSSGMAIVEQALLWSRHLACS